MTIPACWAGADPEFFEEEGGGGWLVPWDCQIQITENYSTRDTGNATNILAKITCNYNEVSVQSLCLISSITVFLKFLLL